MQFFDALGRHVSGLWKGYGYDDRAFTEAATRALVDMPPSESLSPGEAVYWAMTCDALPQQEDIGAHFGQPPLTLYWGREFRIELLFWVRGVPGIHEHSFSGAFHVLQGSSLHTLWSFVPFERFEWRLIGGKLRLVKAELLSAGDTRPIIAGDKMIHATFHLDCPSVSVVIRTNGELHSRPQYSYLPPSIAFAPYHTPQVIQRRIQLLSMLRQSGREDQWWDVLRLALETSDAYSVFHYLMYAYGTVDSDTVRTNLLMVANLRHKLLVQYLAPMLPQLRRREQIAELRQRIVSPDLQFFLALLVNIRGRDNCLRLVSERYPSEDPVNVVLDWVGRLSKDGLLGFEFPTTWYFIMRGLLSGQSEGAIAKDLSGQPFPRRNGSVNLHDLGLLCSRLRQYWLLEPILGVDESCVNDSDETVNYKESPKAPTRAGDPERVGDRERVGGLQCG